MDKNQLVIGCTNGSMVHLHLHQYQIKEQEWRMESRIGRYFSLFSSNVNKPSSIVALEVLRTSLDGDILVICLCYDATVRIWSVKSQSCTRIQCLVDRYRVEAEEPISCMFVYTTRVSIRVCFLNDGVITMLIASFVCVCTFF